MRRPATGASRRAMMSHPWERAQLARARTSGPRPIERAETWMGLWAKVSGVFFRQAVLPCETVNWRVFAVLGYFAMPITGARRVRKDVLPDMWNRAPEFRSHVLVFARTKLCCRRQHVTPMTGVSFDAGSEIYCRGLPPGFLVSGVVSPQALAGPASASASRSNGARPWRGPRRGPVYSQHRRPPWGHWCGRIAPLRQHHESWCRRSGAYRGAGGPAHAVGGTAHVGFGTNHGVGGAIHGGRRSRP